MKQRSKNIDNLRLFVLIIYGILLITPIFFSFRYRYTNVRAAGVTFYVSATGNDANAGSQSSPFRTFSKAISILKPGDTLHILQGTYTEKIRIPVTISGTQTNPILIQAKPGDKVVVDLQNSSQSGVEIFGNYINISDLEVRNIAAICIKLDGNFINARHMIVHHCLDHGVQIQGQHINFADSEIYFADLMNRPGAAGSGWPSGFKIRTGEYITVERNKIHNNYGEGMGLRGKHIVVKNNIVYDNYSVNIYADNSADVLIEANFVYCTNNQEFYRDGNCATNFGLAEEFYTGWGSNLGQIKIINNLSLGGFRGLNYHGHESGIIEPGLKGAIIANNTFWGSVEREIIFVDEPFSHDIFFYNNIVQQNQGKLADFKGTRGITKDYNFWVGTATTLINASGPNDKTGDIKLQSVPIFSNPSTFKLSSSSPAIDSGIRITEVSRDFEGRLRNSLIDIGAYEYVGSAGPLLSPTQIVLPSNSVTPSPTRTPTPVLPTVTPGTNKPGDANGDGSVNSIDLWIWLLNFGHNTPNGVSEGDFTGDGRVDVQDFIVLLNNYGS